MFKINYILMIILLSPVLSMATMLKTSDHLSNLEIMTDGCEKRSTKMSTQESDEAAEKEVHAPKTQEVETVNFSLHGCNGVASFPVTVRTHKKQGE